MVGVGVEADLIVNELRRNITDSEIRDQTSPESAVAPLAAAPTLGANSALEDAGVALHLLRHWQLTDRHR